VLARLETGHNVADLKPAIADSSKPARGFSAKPFKWNKTALLWNVSSVIATQGKDIAAHSVQIEMCRGGGNDGGWARRPPNSFACFYLPITRG